MSRSSCSVILPAHGVAAAHLATGACIIWFAAAPFFCGCLEAVVQDATTEPSPAASTASIQRPGWNTVQSAYFAIEYKPDVSMRKVERYLRKRTFYLWSGERGSDVPADVKVACRIDAIFERVKEVLDMRPVMPKLTIKIFETIEELNGEYYRIFGTRPEDEMQSFYVHKLGTIFTSEDDISDSLIAHEMAHAIVDHYFTTIPPQKIGEVMASYVDMHLTD